MSSTPSINLQCHPNSIGSKNLQAESKEPPKIQLKRQLTLWNGVGILVGYIIGSGIFISPTGVLRYSGSVGLSLSVWLFCGIMAGIGAYCMTELGTMIPKSGGVYIYLLESFGEMSAFLYLWTSVIIVRPLGGTVLLVTFANYLLQPLFHNCESLPDVAVRLLAVIALGFLIWLNCFSTRLALIVQDALSFTKILAMIIIGVIGGYFLATGYTKNYEDPFSGSNWSVISIATAYFQGSFAFGGWFSLNAVIEEMKNPIRDLPRAIWIAISLITFVYLVANVAYFAILSPEEMLASNAVAASFGSKLYEGVAWLMSILVAGSAFGGFDSTVISSSRMIFSGSREGHLPECLALINIEKLNPMAAIIFFGCSTVLVLAYLDVVFLITYLGVAESIFLWMAVISVIWFRYKKPELERPIKIWLGFPIIYGFFGLLVIILSILENPIGLGVTLAVTFAGIPVYILCIKWEKSRQKFVPISNKLTRIIQILTVSLPETKTGPVNE